MNSKQVLHKIRVFLLEIGYVEVQRNRYQFSKECREIFFNIQKSNFEDGFYINVRVEIGDEIPVDGRFSLSGIDLGSYLWTAESFEKLDLLLKDAFLPFHQSVLIYCRQDRDQYIKNLTNDFLSSCKFMLNNDFFGFEKDGAIIFCRKRGCFWDLALLEVFGLGNFLHVRCGVWLPELQCDDSIHEDSPVFYQDLVILQNKIMNGFDCQPNLLKINCYESRSTVDVLLSEWLLNEALPYFAAIHDFDSFYDSIQLGYKNSSYLAKAFEKIKQKIELCT